MPVKLTGIDLGWPIWPYYLWKLDLPYFMIYSVAVIFMPHSSLTVMRDEDVKNNIMLTLDMLNVIQET